MKKRLCLVGIVLTALLLTTFAWACVDNTPAPPPHEHTYATEWSASETEHWYAATCEHAQEIADKAVHAFGDWQVTKQPTHTQEGEQTRTCTVCNYAQTQSVAADVTAHETTRYEAVLPTCLEGGNIEYWVCESCDKYFSDANGTNEIVDKASVSVAIDATNHVSENFEYVSNGDGKTHAKKYECCKAEAVAEEACSGGSATCTEQATCSKCNAKYGDTAAHVFGRELQNEYTLQNEGTCIAKATHYKTCNDCDAVSDKDVFDGETNASNHASENFEYVSNGDNATHSQKRACCKTVVVATEECSGGSENTDGQAICEHCQSPYYPDRVLKSTSGGTVQTLTEGAKVWSTNDYVFKSMPKAFIGQPYLLWTINGPNKATAIRSGWVYVITGEALNFSDTASQMEKLDGYHFTLLDTQFWNLWTASLKNNFIYEKKVQAGEEFELGRWSVVITSDVRLDVYAGEPIEQDKDLAVLKPTGSDGIVNMTLSAKVFSDRAYTFYDMPFWLAGKNYIQCGYATKTHSATVSKSGWVYMLTSKAGSISLTSSLTASGWTNVTNTIPSDLNLFGDSTQNGAFLNNTYQGFALLKKKVTAGETLTWGQWGIPVFSGEIVLADNVAKLVAAATTSLPAKTEEGMRLFSNRTYYAMDGVPTGLQGLTYFMDGIDTGATVKAETAGTAYLMIPSGTKAYATLETEVQNAGWTLVPARPFRLAVGVLFANRLYSKQVTVGEQIHFGKYNLVFGAPQASESDYYVMPSLTTGANLIVNPVGDAYDTDKQNWLGCPTIEKTAGGRLWSGWFTGGKKELGTGNYAIIGYSDDEGAQWKKTLAVVHPDTAVQVTKPELWTAPNGDLWLFWVQHTGTGNFDGKMGNWASVCANPDAAEPTWSTPRRLSDGYLRSKPIIVDVKGTTTWMYTAFDWMDPHLTKVYASVDDGASWSLRGSAECLDTSSGKNNLDDPVLTQKPDGTLWLLVRPSSGAAVYESFSTDGGYTWTRATASNIIGPQSRFTIDLLADGKMLMVFHDATTRSRLTAFLSVDGGKTWAYKLLLDERGGVSYPDTIITSDGSIYVIYDRNRTSDMEIFFTVFTVDDVIAGAFTSDTARQPVLVDKPQTV